MYRIEFYTRAEGLQSGTYRSAELALAMWNMRHKRSTLYARFYAPNGELIDKFSNWAS